MHCTPLHGAWRKHEVSIEQALEPADDLLANRYKFMPYPPLLMHPILCVGGIVGCCMLLDAPKHKRRANS